MIRYEKRSKAKMGQNNPMWNGGKYISHGYFLIKRPEHPFHDKDNYIPEHRLIYEESRDCCLLRWADVHHIDGNKLNNIWYNLQALIHGDHSILSNRVDYSNYRCSICKSHKTHFIKTRNRFDWRYIDGKPVCGNCYRSDYNRRVRGR